MALRLAGGALRGASVLRRGLSTTATVQKKHEVLVFNGDGIGPEIVGAARRMIDATGVNIEWMEMEMGYEAQERTGTYISQDHLMAFDTVRVLFKGPLTVPPASKSYIEIKGRKFTSGNQVFRKMFQLYANVRPARNRPGVKSPADNVDLVVVRENTEDVYLGKERWVDDDTVECIKQISRKASERIANFALDYAERHGRKRVTCVHKANVCKQSDGLFLSEFNKAAAKRTSGLRCDDQLADSLLTKMVLSPSEWDVLCCPNLYGDMTSDLSGGLVGSLGLLPSANIGDHHALFEPAHGSAPDIAGKGIANPASQLLSGVMMLAHLGEHEAAQRLENAFEQTLKDGILPVDLGGTTKTDAMTEAILARL